MLSAHANYSHTGNSRLFGFFTTLPGLWRAFQCLKRAYDTRSSFPHLLNAGKYCATIIAYMTLSLFRINKTHEHLALYCVFASINGVYCSVWDVVFDFSELKSCSIQGCRQLTDLSSQALGTVKLSIDFCATNSSFRHAGITSPWRLILFSDSIGFCTPSSRGKLSTPASSPCVSLFQRSFVEVCG